MSKVSRTDLHVVLAILMCFVGEPVFAEALKLEKAPPPDHYQVTIDPKAEAKDLLPTPPKNALPGGALLVDDLARVPEVSLHEPILVPSSKDKAMTEEQAKLIQKALIHTAKLTAHINFINKNKTDRFVELLMENRPDLAGMPFAMGDACRQKVGERKQFKSAVEIMQAAPLTKLSRIRSEPEGHDWAAYDQIRNNKVHAELPDSSCAAAYMQMLALESAKVRLGLVERLAKFDKNDKDKAAATQALTRLAVFAQEEEVRKAALAALVKRDQGGDSAVLLHGLRYPWPSIAKNAAVAIAELKQKDLIPQLVKVLEEPDPRAPVKGEKGETVREVVRVNHHRNCLLCHPPGNTPDVMKLEVWKDQKGREVEKGVEMFYCQISKQADDVLTGAVPTPGEPLPSASDGYRRFSSPDILVRADVTYLRQDFSMAQKVADAHPWPELQRFDYFVRTRTLTAEQASAYRAEFAKLEATPYRDAAQAALRSLTKDDTSQ